MIFQQYRITFDDQWDLWGKGRISWKRVFTVAGHALRNSLCLSPIAHTMPPSSSLKFVQATTLLRTVSSVRLVRARNETTEILTFVTGGPVLKTKRDAIARCCKYDSYLFLCTKKLSENNSQKIVLRKFCSRWKTQDPSGSFGSGALDWRTA